MYDVKYLEEQLEKEYDIKATVKEDMIRRTNSKKPVLGLMVVPEGSNVGPTIYPAPDQPIEDILKDVANAVRNTPEIDLNMSKERILKDAVLTVLSSRNRDMLEERDIPYTEVAEGILAAPKMVMFDMPDGKGTSWVTMGVAKNAGLTKEELMDAAYENVQKEKFSTPAMGDLLNELAPGLADVPESAITYPSMYVVTNDSKIDGARGLLNEEVLTALKVIQGGDFYILPSSRHEFISVPKSDEFDPDSLRALIREVNATQVAESDFLSDELYESDGKEISCVLGGREMSDTSMDEHGDD